MNQKWVLNVVSRYGRKKYKRRIIEYAKTHKDFGFLKYGPKDEDGQPTPPEGADFALKAYGSNGGKIVVNDLDAQDQRVGIL